MKTGLKVVTAVAAFMLLVASIAGPTIATADEAGWLIDRRELPPPAGASDVMRAAIAGAPAPNVAAATAGYPKSAAEWRSLIAQSESVAATPLEVTEKQLGVAIKRDTLAGVKVHRVTPASVAPAHDKHLFIYIHGGAYVFGGGDASVSEGALIASTSGIRVVSIDYRMPPDHPFPAAVDDVVAVYKELLKEHPAAAMAIGGTSAGGGLALAAVHQFKSLGLPVPGAIYAGTPWADLTKTGDTLYTNAGIDHILVTYDGMLAGAARLYANGHDLKDPLVSPVYGDFDGFSPTYLVTGTRDMLLSDTVRTHRKLRQAGIVADLNVYEGLSHADYIFVPDSPEAAQVYAGLSAFLLAHLR